LYSSKFASSLTLSAIIPVKTFSQAKTRLELDETKKEQLCQIMLEEVLQTISDSQLIGNIVVVSKDETALKLSKKFNPIQIIDEDESGVNHAVSLADQYLKKNNFNASIVFPQDIPLMKTQDIDYLLQFQSSPECVIVAPSRKFDGTNALLRMPVHIMETHYDEDSYKIHLEKGKEHTNNTSLVFVRRIMLDIDAMDDLDLILAQNEKPELCDKIRKLLA